MVWDKLVSAAFIRRIGGEELPEPEHISEGLRQVILKACAFHADDRYKTAEEFRENARKAVLKQMIWEKITANARMKQYPSRVLKRFAWLSDVTLETYLKSQKSQLLPKLSLPLNCSPELVA